MSTQEKNKDWKPVEDDYHYSGENSTRAWPALLFSTLLAIGMFAVAWMRYNAVKEWEITGGTIRMYSIEKLAYDIGGPAVMPVIFVFGGFFFFYLGVKQYKHKKRLQQL